MSSSTNATSPLAGAVIVAAGASRRMGGIDKTFVEVLGVPLILHTLRVFQASPLVGPVVLVLPGENVQRGLELARHHGLDKVQAVCAGGARRQDSVREGLQRLPVCQWVLVHDGARPCLDQRLIAQGLEAALETGAAIAAVPVKDTIKVVSSQGLVESTPPRNTLWAVQTPQVFRYDLLMEAHQRITQDVTDDASMVERLGVRVKVYMGSYDNLKVTTPEDLHLAEAILRSRSHGERT